MLSTHWARPRVRIGAIAFTALLLAGFTAVLGAQAATSEVAVSPLTIVSGTANGTIDGFAANSQVDVDGHTQQADQNGRVTLVSAPLDGDGVLTLGFTDPDGKPQTVNVDLTDAVTGLPLTPGQVGGPLASTTRAVSFTTGSSTPSGGGGSTGGGGTGGGGTGGGSGSGSTPAGAVTTPAGVSIPASSVVAGAGAPRDRSGHLQRNHRPIAHEADPDAARGEGHAGVSRPRRHRLRPRRAGEARARDRGGALERARHRSREAEADEAAASA